MTFFEEKMDIPILPIPNVVFFPNTTLPIVVAEPTYIRMVKECVHNNSMLGISMAEPTQEFEHHTKYSPHKIGSIGKVIILEEYEDGSLKVLVRGKSRVRLNHVIQNIPYLVYNVTLLPDINNGTSVELGENKLSKLKGILDDWIDAAIPDSLERETFQNSLLGTAHIIDYLSTFLVDDRRVRQILLENTSLPERVQILSSILNEKGEEPENPFMVNAIKDFNLLDHKFKMVH
tara:strand:+ start:67832 stop:68530 length:699 start_codon:yes stop_codon:yes gene_type:complete